MTQKVSAQVEQARKEAYKTSAIIVLAIALFIFGMGWLVSCGTTATKAISVQSETVEVATTVGYEEETLEHLAYWTVATEPDRWPEIDQFNIVACHDDPDEEGNAEIVFLLGEIQTDDLVLTYFNGYFGIWSDEVKLQIIAEIQDSVRPHVPGFTLNRVEIIQQ